MRIRRFAIMSMAASFLLATGAPCLAAEPRCAGCGMKVDLESRFASKIVRGQETQLFCDVGDLLKFLDQNQSSIAAAKVKDHRSGEWIRAHDAFYVRSEKAFSTPMRWGIAAFAKKEDAAAFGAPMDLAAARRALR